jgi:hypothetical protein
MRRIHHSILVVIASGASLLGGSGCQRAGDDIPDDPFALPPPALTARAERDSGRVAQLVISYFGYLDMPDGGILVEGRSAEAAIEIDLDRQLEAPVEIELLRRAETELLEESYREKWFLRFTVLDEDSTQMERTIHILRHLGSDTRYLGRMLPEAHGTTR